MRIVFMGTPEFAVPSLEILLEAGHEICAVVTAPDRPSGRGRQLRPSAVKEAALRHGLPLLQPEKLRDPAFLQALHDAAPQLGVVVAFRMLPEMVWALPTLGTLNLHASLLPDYRGAAPINWALIHGETRTGATTFLLDKEIDTGNILLQSQIDIPDDWTAGHLHDELMMTGARLVLETVRGLESGTLVPRPQEEAAFRHPAPKLFKEMGEIQWNQPADTVYHFVRGLSPVPTAWTSFGGEPVNIFLAKRTGQSADGRQPGSIYRPQPDHMFVACADQWLEILSLQMPGKKRMSAGDFLRGWKGEMEQFEQR